ncbi:DUF4112 domain-containing protein [Rhodocytophaga aerolata]|uniref:DUF4112 domain-containing protein n=1 Tax=Rhodocytophaga aerolata TaxID=455078 RepID=A0ABT8R2S7_9BACT|nr:DUF4112 domain-containing protein [Rhodocytophaga aerolata]MDO1445674.1 DUF4112 domain-containing protein [Rhodocytophaga aerolata]
MANAGKYSINNPAVPHAAQPGISYGHSGAMQPQVPLRDIHELKWIERVINVMDNRFRIPGTNIRFGLDPIIGLFPIVGEAVTFSISSILILSMVKYGVSRKVIIKMIGNVMIDAAVGSIPLIGDLFDVAYKANYRNYKLLKEHQLEGKHSGSGTGLLIGVGLVLLVLLGVVVFVLWKLIDWFIGLF